MYISAPSQSEPLQLGLLQAMGRLSLFRNLTELNIVGVKIGQDELRSLNISSKLATLAIT